MKVIYDGPEDPLFKTGEEYEVLKEHHNIYVFNGTWRLKSLFLNKREIRGMKLKDLGI